MAGRRISYLKQTCFRVLLHADQDHSITVRAIHIGSVAVNIAIGMSIVDAHPNNMVAVRSVFRAAAPLEPHTEGVMLSQVQAALGTPFFSGASFGTQRAKAVGWERFLRAVFDGSQRVRVPTRGGDHQPRGKVEGLVRLARR